MVQDVPANALTGRCFLSILGHGVGGGWLRQALPIDRTGCGAWVDGLVRSRLGPDVAHAPVQSAQNARRTLQPALSAIA
jgi:hypothetical protein